MPLTISGDIPNFSAATITAGTITTGTVTTLNALSGVLATQNGMTGIAKAWVNFDGTGTPSIRGSFNVSSITDNGTGDYTVNFTTAMPNANYSINVNARGNGDANRGAGGLVYLPNATLPTTSAVRFSTYLGSTENAPGLIFDQDYIFVSVFSS